MESSPGVARKSPNETNDSPTSDPHPAGPPPPYDPPPRMYSEGPQVLHVDLWPRLCPNSTSSGKFSSPNPATVGPRSWPAASAPMLAVLPMATKASLSRGKSLVDGACIQ
ncbi:uncharacterized protein LOC129014986 isoform X2 [Pongo pygmaeus]|uniref:uncharacterized protein LOC129014986 isoform X2 n=1 Tax=Pongo pygmaeus TaxID=9600 RepID=UPI0023E32AFC|nr:uncharacterized protein LOC129014986 isoform X2 [Pongo pygmaeus]